MRCPSCQTENEDHKKFCRKCGADLRIVCPECGAEVLPADNFCGECGGEVSLSPESLVSEPSFAEQLTRIQRYLPQGLTEKILAQKGKIEGERKQVSVMFCDLEGFTRLSEKLDPEEAYNTMDRVYEILIHQVYAFGGTVNELTGDGVMALFGAPVALEDHPQRAIRAALAIQRAMARLGETFKKETAGLSALRMRIGVHTGPVVVGSLGNDLRVEFKAVGDTVNLASRMEGLAQPGTIYVSAETFRLTEGLFRFEAQGNKRVKGREQPLGVYRVIATSSSRTRFDVSAERGLAPFVGRERELELLFDEFTRAREGRGQAFSIVAEAGVGKSRLLYEFRKELASENVTFIEGRCLSYGRTAAYHTVLDTLKSNFFIQDNDAPAEIKAKIKRGLEQLKADLDTTYPYLLDLFSIDDPSASALPRNPEVRKHRTFDAVNQIVLRGSEMRPLILAVEDLHWIDLSSEEYLKQLMACIPASRVFLILTYRPEFALTWGARSYHGQVNLNRLSNRESLTMVRHILGSHDLDPRLETLILEKTEGIPLFVEEFTRSLLDLGLLERHDDSCYLADHVREVGIPATIQDVIMARVDSLPEGARAVLKAGSVIERQFTYELIAQVAGFQQPELLSHLSALKDSELIYERGIYPDATYIFKHPLTREVVYNSILTENRRALHERVGRALEEIHTEKLEEFYGVLASHFIASGNHEKGAEYSELAAKKANKAGSFLTAVEHARRRVACYENAGESATDARCVVARMTLAGYYMVLSDLVNAKKAVAPIIEATSLQGYQERLPGIHTALGLYHLWVEEDSTKGLRFLQGVLRVTKKTKKNVWQWFANYYVASYLAVNCEFQRAHSFLATCQRISEAAQDHPGIVTVKSTVAFYQAMAGEVDRAYQASGEALRLAQETDHPNANLVAYLCHGVACYYHGLFTEAEKTLRTGLDWYERTAQKMYGFMMCSFLGDVYCELGRPGKARECYERGIAGLEESGMLPSWLNILHISVARARALEGNRDATLGQLSRHYRANNFKLWKGSSARNIAEIQLAGEDHPGPEAEEWLNRAIAADRENAAPWYEGHDLLLYAKLCRRRRDLEGAREHLGRAVEIFRECGASGFKARAEGEIAGLGL